MEKEILMMRMLSDKSPNWGMNKISPLRTCKEDILCCGLSDANTRDGLLWFSKEEDIEYICNALNFYETYYPIFNSLKFHCEQFLNELNKEDKNKENNNTRFDDGRSCGICLNLETEYHEWDCCGTWTSETKCSEGHDLNETDGTDCEDFIHDRR